MVASFLSVISVLAAISSWALTSHAGKLEARSDPAYGRYENNGIGLVFVAIVLAFFAGRAS